MKKKKYIAPMIEVVVLGEDLMETGEGITTGSKHAHHNDYDVELNDNSTTFHAKAVGTVGSSWAPIQTTVQHRSLWEDE